MMFKKLHTTGLNKKTIILRPLALLLVLLMLCQIPVFGAENTTLKTDTVTAEQFTDLVKTAWYYEEVSGAIEAGLFQGVSDTIFRPMGSITRAQFLQALANLCMVDLSPYTEHPFKDVGEKSWYRKCVSWGYSMGIVDGVSADRFAPDAPITREAMSKMIVYTLEKFFGKTMEADTETVFKDQASISKWALKSVQKAVKAGLFQGDKQGNFTPQNNANRAQAACVLVRYYRGNPIESLKVEGFDLQFDPDTDYYLCYPSDFTACRILSYTGVGKMKIEVAQYTDYYPYVNTKTYELGDTLELGNGRAKVTLRFSGSDREYLIALTDPKAVDYSYAYVRGDSVNLRAAASTNGAIIKQLSKNTRVYYLGTEGDWCKVQLRLYDTVGYIHKDYLQFAWAETEMPERYKAAIEALQAAHPNWTFSFVDVEMSYTDALKKYGEDKEVYIDPLNYLQEEKIFAMLDIDTYDPSLWTDEGIAAIWANETAITKKQAVEYFNQASSSILMNPIYIACRAALESGYGTSKFAKGTVSGYEGYYNFFGIQCIDSAPEKGAAYARDRNWNSVFRSIVEGANWVKDQYLDQGAVTPYFFRYAGLQNKSYMTDAQAPLKESRILAGAYTDPNAKAHFIIPVYSDMPEL